MRNILVAILITATALTFWAAGTYPQAFIYIDTAFKQLEVALTNVRNNVAAVLLHKPVTVAELKEKYNAPTPKKIRVLIVAGHEPDYGGTEYAHLKERDMNVDLAVELAGFLKNNGHYDVMLSRDKNEWNPALLNYFKTQWDEIIAFYRDNKAEMLHKISTGKASEPAVAVYHNKAKTDVALRLYGINKWGNENAVDIALHVHFNDYPRPDTKSPGKYNGFSIYVPERQYANSGTTKVVAESVFRRLSKYNAVSNLPQEDDGIIEDSELIAIGAQNTSNAASLLIEYGYIYEPQFQNEDVRKSTIKDLAFQTYLGLQDFFGSGNDVTFAYDTLMLPHSWQNQVPAQQASATDALALQSALLLEGEYPADGKTKNDCPRSGRVGPCTLEALTAFQKKYGIKGEHGVIGEKTREILNQRYSLTKSL